MRIRDYVWMALVPVLASCGGGSSGGGGNCGDSTPCGGNLVGTWRVTKSCIDTDSASSPVSSCPGATVHGSNLAVEGTVTYSTDGTYSTDTKMSGSLVAAFPSSCLTQGSTTLTCAQVSQLAAQAGGASLNCTDASGGGCSCTMSIPSTSNKESGTYTVSGNVLTTVHSGTTDQSDYCVRGNELFVKPRAGSSSGVTGTVVGTRQ